MYRYYVQQKCSYSGEKTVEIHCHGSIAIINKLASILTQCGSELDISPQKRVNLQGKLFIMENGPYQVEDYLIY